MGSDIWSNNGGTQSTEFYFEHCFPPHLFDHKFIKTNSFFSNFLENGEKFLILSNFQELIWCALEFEHPPKIIIYLDL